MEKDIVFLFGLFEDLDVVDSLSVFGLRVLVQHCVLEANTEGTYNPRYNRSS